MSVKSVSIAAAAVLVLGVVGAGLYYDSARNDDADADVTSTYTPPVGAGGPTAVFIGDSYTSGAGASELDKRWTTVVAASNFWTEKNMGIGSTGYLTRSPDCATSPCGNYESVVADAVAAKPQVVFVSGGLNDMPAFVDDPAPVVNAIYTTFGTLRAGLPDARIVAVGPTAAGDVPPFITAYDSVVRDAAAAVGAEFISLTDPVDVITEDMLAPDGLHVDDEGHAAIAARVSAALK